MASTYLTRTPASSGTQTKATISVWLKRSNLTSNQCFFSTGNNNVVFKFVSNDKLTVYDYNGSSFDLELTTTQLFRDVSAWYHIVVTLDSTQATASDRAKLYVNGSLISNFDSTTYPSLNYNFKVNGTLEHFIGRLSGLSQYFDGSLTHFHCIDGTAYDASAFGETDATTGEWVGKTSPSVTYGTNGFFILKDGNGITDQSGEGNDFTLGGGTLTDLKDSPDNTFATINLLQHSDSGQTLSNGNLTATNSGSFSISNSSTICNNIGKYYAECKIQSIGDSNTGIIIGFINVDKEPFQNIATTDYYPGDKPYGAGWYSANGSVYINQSGVLSLNSFTTGDVLQFAMDLDNGYFYFGKNGTWQNSANPTSGSTGTGGLALSSMGSSGDTFTFGSSTKNNAITNYNFGNGYFGTTAVASAGTNASDNGIFEYDVPTGYTALSTKGLNL